MVEHLTFNQGVVGSSPTPLTTEFILHIIGAEGRLEMRLFRGEGRHPKEGKYPMAGLHVYPSDALDFDQVYRDLYAFLRKQYPGKTITLSAVDKKLLEGNTSGS